MIDYFKLATFVGIILGVMIFFFGICAEIIPMGIAGTIIIICCLFVSCLL